MRRPTQIGPVVASSLSASSSQRSRFAFQPRDAEPKQPLSAQGGDASPSESAKFLSSPRRSSCKGRASLAAAGGGPPLYVLTSGALYGSDTFKAKYVLTQIIVLQSAFYFLYALFALGALTFFAVDRGDWLPGVPFTGEDASGSHNTALTPVTPSAEPAPGRNNQSLVGLPPLTEYAEGEFPRNGAEHENNDSVRTQGETGRERSTNAARSSRRRRGRAPRRTRILFDTGIYTLATSEGRVLLSVLFFTSIAMSYLVFMVVQRARKCLDFCFSIHFFHLLACWAFDGFPSSPSWWLCSAASATATTAISQYFCRQVEMQDIQLERQPAGSRRGSSEAESVTSVGSSSSDGSSGFGVPSMDATTSSEAPEDLKGVKELPPVLSTSGHSRNTEFATPARADRSFPLHATHSILEAGGSEGSS